MKTNSVKFWLGGASFAAILLAQPAVAQTGVSEEEQAAATNEAAEEAESAEIIVTATRRAESQLRVPLSVTALAQEDLDARGIKDFTDVVRATPGLVYDVTNTTTNISIRGINSTVGAATTGVYIDDTPIQARNLGYGGGNVYPTIFDLERVEVLRGPQGTLFGAGSMGGTIRFITPRPSLRDLDFYGRAELATTENGSESYELGLAVGAPIVPEILGVRVSGFHRRDGGWIDRVRHEDRSVVEEDSNFQRVTVARAAVTWKPTPELQITPSLSYQKQYTNDSFDSWDQIGDVPFSDYENGEFLNANWVQEWTRDRFWLPAVNMEYDFDGFDLIAIASYFDRRQTFLSDYTVFDQSLFTGALSGGAGISLPIFPNQSAESFFLNTQKNYTGEVRLQSDDAGSRLNWVFGAFWSRSKQLSIQQVEDLFFPQYVQLYIPPDIYPLIFPPLVDGRLIYDQNTSTVDEQYAAFGQITYRLTEQLSLIAGLRYGVTKFEISSLARGPVVGPPAIDKGNQKEEPFTPKFGINFQATPDALLYASASKGFRPGGYNPQIGSPCGPELAALGFPDGRPELYKSDTVWSYEVGAKTRLGRSASLQASAYQINWKDIQQPVGLGSCGFQFTANLGSARVRGFDIQADVRPAAGLTLSAAVGYTNGEFLDTIRLGAATNSLVTEGDNLPAPPWTVSLLGEYERPLSGDNEAYVRGTYDYRSHQEAVTPFLNPENTGGVFLTPGNPPAINYVTLRAGVRMGDLDISAFVNNLFDETPWTRRVIDNAFSNIRYSQIVRPRTFGITAAYRY